MSSMKEMKSYICDNTVHYILICNLGRLKRLCSHIRIYTVRRDVVVPELRYLLLDDGDKGTHYQGNMPFVGNDLIRDA